MILCSTANRRLIASRPSTPHRLSQLLRQHSPWKQKPIVKMYALYGQLFYRNILMLNYVVVKFVVFCMNGAENLTAVAAAAKFIINCDEWEKERGKRCCGDSRKLEESLDELWGSVNLDLSDNCSLSLPSFNFMTVCWFSVFQCWLFKKKSCWTVYFFKIKRKLLLGLFSNGFNNYCLVI